MGTGEPRRSMPTGAQDLLQRFKPQLRYDSQEAFFADSAAEMTDNPGNTLRRAPKDDAPGDLIAEANGTDPSRKLSLPFLAVSAYQNGEAVRSDDRLGIVGQKLRVRTFVASGSVGYPDAAADAPPYGLAVRASRAWF